MIKQKYKQRVFFPSKLNCGVCIYIYIYIYIHVYIYEIFCSVVITYHKIATYFIYQYYMYILQLQLCLIKKQLPNILCSILCTVIQSPISLYWIFSFHSFASIVLQLNINSYIFLQFFPSLRFPKNGLAESERMNTFLFSC